jgi:hypothetical protein
VSSARRRIFSVRREEYATVETFPPAWFVGEAGGP